MIAGRLNGLEALKQHKSKVYSQVQPQGEIPEEGREKKEGI